MGKVLTEVRSPQRKFMLDKVGPEIHEPTSLRGIAAKAGREKQHRFRDLYRCLNVEMLLWCWRGLNKDAASGVDGITKADYEVDLQSNIQRLVKRLKEKRYRTKLVRRVYIPKGNGGERPLGIPALEDKLVQMACTKLLTAIYEADFMDDSYGYRTGRGALDAVKELTTRLRFGAYGYVVEADIKGFFNNMDHDWLLRMLEQRIDDRAFLGLIRKWLKAGILETDGKVIHPETGTPQGGIISPVLANVYLHYALDLWFEKIVKSHCRGEATIIRYADDWVCAFQYKGEAERFYKVLPKRLSKFGLEVATDKTRLLCFSRYHVGLQRRFTFLGFEFYWKEGRNGKPCVARRTDPKKLQAACRRIKDWIKCNRHQRGKEFFRGLNRRLWGHYNYYGIIGNSRAIERFYFWALQCTLKWLNRRGGQRKSYDKEHFKVILKHVGIARPRITQKRVCKVFA